MKNLNLMKSCPACNSLGYTKKSVLLIFKIRVKCETCNGSGQVLDLSRINKVLETSQPKFPNSDDFRIHAHDSSDKAMISTPPPPPKFPF
jgi:hypothetical protein